MSAAGTLTAGLSSKDIVRQQRLRMQLEPLIGATSAQGGQVTGAMPSDQPGNPGPGLASEQAGS